MKEEDFRLAGIEFFKIIESQIDYITEDIIPLQYDKQKKFIHHLTTYLDHNSIPELEELPILNDSVKELNETKKNFEQNSIANKYTEQITKEDLSRIYKETAKLINENILYNINDKIFSLQTSDVQSSAGWDELEQKYAMEYYNSSEEKHHTIIESYRRELNEKLQSNIREQQQRVEASRQQNQSTSNVEKHAFVNAGLLSDTEMSYLVHNYELLNTLLFMHSNMQYPNKLFTLFYSARNFYPGNSNQGFIELGEIDYQKVMIMLSSNILKLLTNKGISFKDINYLTQNDLKQISFLNNIKNNDTLLSLVVKKNIKSVLLHLLNINVNITDKYDHNLLHYAILYKRFVSRLIDAGIDVNSRTVNGETPLHFAVNIGNLTMVEKLIKAAADINAKTTQGETALHFAVMKKDIKIIKKLIQYGADVKSKTINRKTALHFAAEKGYTKIAKLLIKSEAPIDAQTIEGKAVIHFAADNGYIKIVKELIKHGANINIKTLENVTPLYMATKNKNIKIVKNLLKYGADANLKTTYHKTPLHLAAENGDIEIVRELIKYGANVNSRTVDSETPLHFAANKGNTKIVKELIAHGAAINVKTLQGETPLDLAMIKFNPEIINILSEHKASLASRRYLKSFQDFTKIVGNVGMVLDEGESSGHCSNLRRKRAINCKEENRVSYEPLEYEELPNIIQSSINRYYNILLSEIWKIDNNVKQHSKVSKVIKLYGHVVEILKIPKNNWSKNQSQIFKQYNSLVRKIESISLESTILKEITEEERGKYNSVIYDNGQISILMLRNEDHYKLYSANLNYKKLFKIKNQLLPQELNSFIKELFRWHGSNKDYKLYITTGDQARFKELFLTDIDSLMELSDKTLLLTFNHKISNLTYETIINLFMIDNKTINHKELNDDFFKINQYRLTLRVDKLHEFLQNLNTEEKAHLFHIIKEYNIKGSWSDAAQKLSNIEQHLMDNYVKHVIDIVN
ncbi:Ankyrin repeat protein [Rickettsiales bacterium Ac37b]|nr:Ankyrin repeat protein [Rickettsiales bacterium Ac37b]